MSSSGRRSIAERSTGAMGQRVLFDDTQSSLLVHASVVFDTIGALWEAWALHRSNDVGALRLGPVHSARSIGRVPLNQLVRTIDFIVGALTRWSQHRCFYLSYVRGAVLRKRGFPLELNIGLRNLESGTRTRGHCWLMLNNRPFADPADPGVKYPTVLGRTQGGVRCWLGPTIQPPTEAPGIQVKKICVAASNLWRLA